MGESQQFCTFFLDGYLFGTPVLQVQEVIRHQAMTRVPLAPDVVSGVINLRGQIVSAIDLRKRLGFKDRIEDQVPMNVLMRTSEGPVSLLVDEIGDVVEVKEEAFERPPETLLGFAREVVLGVYKLSRGLLLVLDIARIVDLSDCCREPGHPRAGRE